MNFSKVIIWGHKLHSHTHSYVHESFVRAFQFLGYQTLWLDDSDDISNISFENCLFLTEGQVDKKIPLVKSSKYILHNCDSPKYQEYDRVIIQVYVNSILNYDLQKVNEYTFYDNKKAIYQPWATDLLPHEIDTNINVNFLESDYIAWVGSYGGGEFGNEDEINAFKNASQKRFDVFGGYGPKPLNKQEHIKFIQQSFVAPTIVGRWQLKNDYVPCRIFKNISYGVMGVTNSKFINTIFNDLLICNENTQQLYLDYIYFISDKNFKNRIVELMDVVKTKHTYINRIQNIFEIL